MLTFNSEIIIKNEFNHPVHSVGSVPTSANGFGRDEKINVSERLTNFGGKIFVKNIVDESARKKNIIWDSTTTRICPVSSQRTHKS